VAKIELRRGDIVYADLRGSEGSEKQGVRPCVVVQNDDGNTYSPLTIVAPITDQRQFKHLPVQVPVAAADLGDWAKDSVIECGHLRTIDRDARIRKVVGRLSDNVMQAVDAAIRVSVGVVQTCGGSS
jgi:mRNA interferase MazF